MMKTKSYSFLERKWDVSKGKIEKNEKIVNGEVIEETGNLKK